MAAPAAMPSAIALAALFWIAQGAVGTPVQLPMRLESQVAVCPSASELREVLHDLGRAEREYAQGTEVGGCAGDDCCFLRGVCLEALGRVAEAR